jgi:hypothetical protein
MEGAQLHVEDGWPRGSSRGATCDRNKDEEGASVQRHYQQFTHVCWPITKAATRPAGNKWELIRSAVLQHHSQVLGIFGLSMMSTAAIIGAGIFVLTGVVAKQAG